MQQQGGTSAGFTLSCRLGVILLSLFTFAISAHAQEQKTTMPFYEEDISSSNPIRTEQVKELERYLAGLRDDTTKLNTLFKPDYSSASAYATSTKKLRTALTTTLGYPPPGKPEPEAPTFQQVGEDTLATYYRVRISVLPGVHVVGLYLLPKTRTGRIPLVISMHGGGGSPEIALFNGGANYHDMVRGAAEQGYAVWAPTHLFSADGYPPDIRQRMDSRARLAGTTLTAIEILKISRSLDVLLKRPEIAPKRVAMVGLSYGGFYTLLTTALEPRIKVAVSSCNFGDDLTLWEKSEPHGWSDARFMDGLTLFRSPEITALICPRPLEIQMGTKDTLVLIEPGRDAAPKSAAHYQRLGFGENFRFVEFDGGHEWYGKSAWEFLAKHL